MRALLQRVASASVSIGDEVVGKIGRGLVVFVGVSGEDTAEDARYLAQKAANLRIIPELPGHTSPSVTERYLAVTDKNKSWAVGLLEGSSCVTCREQS